MSCSKFLWLPEWYCIYFNEVNAKIELYALIFSLNLVGRDPSNQNP